MTPTHSRMSTEQVWDMTDPVALARLAGIEDLQRAVAGNIHTPAEILDGLAGHEQEPTVREAVAENLSTTSDTLLRLAGDPTRHVRAAVPYHPDVPEQALVQLANDPVASVRKSVAVGESTSPDLLTLLSPGQRP